MTMPAQPELLPLTKIVATIGPATESAEMIDRLIAAGVSIFRLNFSHGTHEDHRNVYDRIRASSAQGDRPVSILQDLQGPKLRIGDLAGDAPIPIAPGDSLIICTLPVEGNRERVSTSYEDLGRDVRAGDTILIDDGLIELRVSEVRRDTPYGDEVVCVVVHGGALKPQKGINLPGTEVSSPALTPKDHEDLAFGVELGVDVVALSFVRSPADIELARNRIRELGGNQPIVAKIEKPQAVQQLEAIVAASDGVMVARGDLGVELSPEAVPLVQKRLIRLANRAGVPVITATQMLESMIVNPRPTRAEASDIANAILDGTDAVMLSGETAVGSWPVRSIDVMTRIARTIEADTSWRLAMRLSTDALRTPAAGNVSQAAAHAAQTIVMDLDAKAIAVLTATGGTAARISQQRPGVPIVAFTDQPSVASRLCLMHGVVPICEPLATTTDRLIQQVDEGIRRLRLAASGDNIVIVGAVPRSHDARSVFLEIHRLR